MNAKSVLLKGSQRPRQSDAQRIGDIDPKTNIEVTLSLKGPALPDADHLPAQESHTATRRLRSTGGCLRAAAR